MNIYNPENDSDLFYWFDASDQSTLKGSGGSNITNGAQVYEWLNKKGSNKWIQLFSVNYPTWIENATNGLSGVRFDGTQALKLNDTSGLTSLDGMTLIIVANAQNATDDQSLFHIGVNEVSQRVTSRLYVYVNGDTTSDGDNPGKIFIGGRRIDSDSYERIVGVNDFTPGKPFIITGALNYSDAKIQAYQDSVIFINTTFQSAGTSADTNPNLITLGAVPTYPSDSSQWNLEGDIYEILLWKKALTQEELYNIHRYLRSKWNVKWSEIGKPAITPRWRHPIYLPENDPELFYWFDASDTSTLKGAGGAAITNGATVYEWLNKKGSQKFIQTSSYNRPTWVSSGIRGQPAVYFNGSQVLGLDIVSDFASLDGLVFFAVASVTSTPSSHQAIINIQNPGSGALANSRAYLGVLGPNVRTGFRRVNTDNTNAIGNDAPVGANERFILLASVNYQTGDVFVYKNGTLVNHKKIQTTGSLQADDSVNITIGSGVYPAGRSHGMIGHIEMIGAANKFRTPDELVPIHHYLRTKWRIEPSTPSPTTTLMTPLSEPPPPPPDEPELPPDEDKPEDDPKGDGSSGSLITN